MLKVHNPEKYQKAKDFRKRGFSYSEIAKIVGVSKATVSNWFARQAFSKKVRKDNELKTRRDNVKRIALVNRTRRTEREKRYKEVVRSALTEFKHYRHSPLFITGLALYSASGDLKHPTQIRLPSQRLTTHRIFTKFLREFLGVEKPKIYTKEDLTIVNDATAKKKLLRWIDLLPQMVLNSRVR